MISLKETALNKFFREIYLNSDEDMRSARSNHLTSSNYSDRDHRSRRCGGGRHSVYAGNSGGAETRRS
ncbi:unnamed protein product [Brassica rapa]|uniref:Uncharacterized protein n=1 Tax=Brassica campestris TaxID=3711 RepID=A0A8D9I5D9_BRACM|nr:unnamed protein product [Brassica rapa]